MPMAHMALVLQQFSLATFKVAASTDIPVFNLGKLIFFEKKIFYYSLGHLIIVFVLKNYLVSAKIYIAITYLFLSAFLFLIYLKYDHGLEKKTSV